MPLLRINATPSELRVHKSTEAVEEKIANLSELAGPIIIMLHGYKYRPGEPNHCPHNVIFGDHSAEQWPTALGFTGAAANGLAIAFGWHSRGTLRDAHARAGRIGHQLAQLIKILRKNPATACCPIHIIAHSLGAEITLSALPELPECAIQRLILLTGACYLGHANAMLETPAGRSAEVLNITSRENDLFDFLFERLIRPTQKGDRAIGVGINAPNVLNLQLDCSRTLSALNQLGHQIAPPTRRICHWSSYTRSGVMDFYAHLLRAPTRSVLNTLRMVTPHQQDPRWSRLWSPHRKRLVARAFRFLAIPSRSRMMTEATVEGKRNGHAY